MREIKSRFWDKVNNKMIIDTAFIKSGSGAGDWILFLDQQVKCDEGLLFPNSAVRSYQSYEEMEYTGLTDKNKNEIYEDDWCTAKFRTKDGIQVVQGRIIMDEFMWCIDCIGCVGDDIFSINRLHDFEIIGNIYENPELLQL